jgi:hypothetical protein
VKQTLSTAKDIWEFLNRGWTVHEANRRLLAFYIDGQPAWILKACETLREGGIAVPANWRKAEQWAKEHPRAVRRGPRANALTIAKVLELTAIFWYRPAPGEPFGRRPPGRVLEHVAGACGLTVTHVRKILSVYGRRRLGRGLAPGAFRDDPSRPHRPVKRVIKARVRHEL